MNRPKRTTTRLALAALALGLFGTAGTLGTAVLGTASAASAQAAPEGAPGASTGHHGQRMGQVLLSLNLNDKQKSQIRDIMAAARKQNEGVTDRDVRRANFKKAFGQVNAVLTPDQQKQFKEKMDALRKQNQTGQPGQGSN
jgi:Spy/CpxP family protein refolding chaperone